MKKIFLFLFIFIFPTLIISGCSKKTTEPSVCGNGIWEMDETQENCCRDASCPDGLFCQNNQCIKSQCTMPKDCAPDETCQGNLCQKLNCPKCETAKEHFCAKDECCQDSDCDDQKPETLDLCMGKPVQCFYMSNGDCKNDDKFCPTNCQYENDNDCPKIADCQEDTDCLRIKLKNCSAAKFTFNLTDTIFLGEINPNGDNCIIRHTADAGFSGELTSLQGKYYDCVFTKKELAANPDTYERALNSPAESCFGPYLDALADLTASSSIEILLNVEFNDGETSIKPITVDLIKKTVDMEINGSSTILSLKETKTVDEKNITLTNIKYEADGDQYTIILGLEGFNNDTTSQ